MIGGKKQISILASFFLALALVLALSPSPALAEEKFVTILFSGPLTGPGTAMIVPMAHGLEDYARELNSKGGIDGVKVKLIFSDDRYDVARAMSVYQRYRKTPRLVSFFNVNTSACYVMSPLITRDKMPTITIASGAFQAKPGYVFIINPPYQDQFGAALDWVAADWKKKAKSGMPTVGYMGWQGGAGEAFVNGAAQYAKKIGVKFLSPEYFPPGSLKHETWLNRLAQQGANYIYVAGVDPTPPFAIRDAFGMGLTKKIQFFSSCFGIEPNVGLKLVKPEVLEGSVLGSPYLTGDEHLRHPLAKLFTKYRKQPLEKMDPSYLSAIGAAKVLEAGIKMALNKVGYDKINGEAVYQAFQKLQGDLTEGIMAPIALGPKTRMMQREIKFYRVTNGKLVPLSGWIKPPDVVSLGTF